MNVGSFRLTVSAHFVYSGQVGGAEHMIYNLLRGIWRRDVAVTVTCAKATHLAIGFRMECDAQPNVRVVEVGGHGPRFLSEQLACFSGQLASDAVLFPNYFVPPFVPRRVGRVVGVLLDQQYRHFPANFSYRKRVWLRWAHALAIRRAERLVVVSDFVRKDALRLLGNRFAKKLAVVPIPVSWDRFGPNPSTALDSNGPPVILAVAAHYPHKNLATLLRAFAEVLRRRPSARLILCGQESSRLRGDLNAPASLSGLAEDLGIAKSVEIPGYVDDFVLGDYYRRATLFAFPSLFEGFGMPPVEALGLGLPTLTTRCAAIPEVTLGLAQYIDNPMSHLEWADRMIDIADAPARYRPPPEVVALIRATYAPERIASLYLAACS
jgi:glycosyltransferase involved in cell wall biosynthesis